MSIAGGIMVPHPPLIVPEIGGGRESEIVKTSDAYRKAAAFAAALRPDTLIITSPHTVMYSDYFHISPGTSASGDLSRFGAPEVSIETDYDSELVSEISSIARERGIHAGTLGERDSSLDHGTLVPLYFLRKAFEDAGLINDAKPRLRIVRIGLSGFSLSDHYRLGMAIRDAVEKLGRRAVFVASGDLSHKLKDYGPYGFAEEGPVYDERIMRVMGTASFGELLDFDENFCGKAAECGHRSFVIMSGAFDGVSVKADPLSHEDVTGVGYGVVTFTPGAPDKRRCFLKEFDRILQEKIAEQRRAEDPYVSLARMTIEKHISGETPVMPDGLPPEMKSRRAGVFVSLHRLGRLRGCIGTILPVTGSIAEEIMRNAVCAATEDPRFPPVEPDELALLEYSVDVLSDPESIESESELDPKKYGVIVESRGRRGLLLPDLDGVDTPEEQIAISKRKAGIGDGERVSLQRFTVTRHF